MLLKTILAIAAACVAVLPPWLVGRDTGDAGAFDAFEVPLLTRCSVQSFPFAEYRPSISGADQRIAADYRCGSLPLSVDISRFIVQRVGKEAITTSHRAVDPRWTTAALPELRPLGQGLRVREYALDRGITPPGIVWTWYAVGEKSAAEPWEAKLREVVNALALERREAAIFSVTAWSADATANRETLEQAVGELWEWYRQRLRR